MTFFLQFWRECCNVYYMVHLVQKKSTELVEKLFPIKYFYEKEQMENGLNYTTVAHITQLQNTVFFDIVIKELCLLRTKLLKV